MLARVGTQVPSAIEWRSPLPAEELRERILAHRAPRARARARRHRHRARRPPTLERPAHVPATTRSAAAAAHLARLTGHANSAECAGFARESPHGAAALYARRLHRSPLRRQSACRRASMPMRSTGEQMQAIARELNLSETVFVLKPENPAHSAQASASSRPGASCPLLAIRPSAPRSCWRSCARPLVNGERDAIIALEQTIGTVRVGVRLRDGPGALRRVRRAQAAREGGDACRRATASPTRSGLLPREIGFENHTALCLSAGNTFAFVPVAGLEAIARARVERRALGERLSRRASVDGVYLYTRECVHNGVVLPRPHVRPAARACPRTRRPARRRWLRRRRARFRRPSRRRAQAGDRAGPRDGPAQHHHAHAGASRAGKLETVRIGGNAVRVIEGTMAT